KKGAKAVARCVSDNVDDGARVMCAELLGRIGDRAGLPALQGALEAWNPAVRGAAVRALASIPDPSSVEPLKKIVAREDEDDANRALALVTLGWLSDTTAMKAVRDVFLEKPPKHGEDDENPKKGLLRTVAFKALWKSRHLMARGTLIGDVKSALESNDADLQLAATFAASELRASELREPLIHLMTNSDARVRNRAVYAVGKIGDKAAASALVAFVPKVRESRMLNNIAFALERLDPPAFFATARELSTNSQAQIRMNTAFVLGDVKRPEGLPMLKAALEDKNVMVRTSAVRALGQIDDRGSAALLERFVDDPNPSLGRAAVYALYALSGMKRGDLVRRKLYDDGKPADKLEAALLLAKGGDPRVADDILVCLEARTCGGKDVDAYLRATRPPEAPGRTLLAWARGRTDLTDLVAALKPAAGGALAVSDVQASVAQGSFSRARTALDLAGELGDAQAVAILKPLLGHENARLRMHAAIALARKGDADAARVLFADLDNVSHERLPEIARALGRISEPAARTTLGAELAKREQGADTPLAMAAAAARFTWDPEAGFFRMLDGLAAKTRLERDLAEHYVRRDARPVVTSLLRRALAREKREDVKGTLRRLLDVRDARDSSL
ncbi:MAG TPA: HEAT repeat domain-containing protein, partial [Byssovorax sp.]